MSGTQYGPPAPTGPATQFGPPPPNEVTITANGQSISGWQSVRVALGIETCPNSFDIAVTEQYPGSTTAVTISPGDTCKIRLGADVVITGYVDRLDMQIDAGSHTIRLMGRGACGDIIDCSALVTNMQLTGSSLLQLAQQLCQPFGVTVSAPDGDGTQTFLFAVNLGETPYELIETVARYEGFLAYEDSGGNLVLAQVGTKSHASGVSYGINVQGARCVLSVDERFSEYIPQLMAVDRLTDLEAATGQAAGSGNSAGATAYDKGVSSKMRLDGQPRYRPRVIISEAFDGTQFLAARRAAWECARRMGRSQAIRVTVDSWRDSAGKLWTPNYLVPVNLPALKITQQNWVIGSVTFLRDLQSGTTAELELMPPQAFLPQPDQLQLYYNDIYNALHAPGGPGGAGMAPSMGGAP